MLALPSLVRLELIALAVHLEDVNVMREPVEERAGEPFGAEDARPLIERQVARDQDRAPLVAPAETLNSSEGGGTGCLPVFRVGRLSIRPPPLGR
jgi:hypothetical protein